MLQKKLSAKKISIRLLPLGLALLACRLLFPVAPVVTALPVATSQSEATAFAPTADFTLVRIYPQDGDLQNLLADHAKKAQALGQAPFVEFDATWCPPCRAITASLAARNPLMLKAFSGVYLIHADVDLWGWNHPGTGLTFKAIPVFYRLDATGKPTGAVVDGGAWGADTPENIAPVMEKFFHP